MNRFGRRVLLFGSIAFLAVSALVLPRAFAGRGFGGHGCSGRELTPEEMRERMQDGAERVLDRVDATDAQRTAIAALVDELVPEAVSHQKAKRELAKQLHTALAADKVDNAELERIRVAGVVLLEDASKKLTKSLGQASEILTPEQRQELAAEYQRWHE
jgi:periplasmic protein CpxP/Spy